MKDFSRLALTLRTRIHEMAQKFRSLSRPRLRFIEEMLYGIQKSKDVKLSEIGRALEEDISLKKTEERLSRHLKQPGLDDDINTQVAGMAARRVHKDTLLIIDPSDIYKPYARKMPYLGRVRDGSTGKIVNGYWTCHVAACEPAKRRMIPLHLSLWSQKAPDFDSENERILHAVDTIRSRIGDRGIWVMDRGGDRGELFQPFLERGMRFIVRVRGDRHLMYRGHPVEVKNLAGSCPRYYAERIIKQQDGEEKSYHIEFGYQRVKLPKHQEQLYLVVVTGLGEEPLMLLTNLPMRKNRAVLWQVVEGYFSRWMIEETIRFMKQGYNLEDLRLLDYDRLRNMVALVLAVAFFTAVELGENTKLSVLTRHITKLAKRFFGVPDFHYYALAEGIARLLRRTGRGYLPGRKPRPPDIGQLPLFDIT